MPDCRHGRARPFATNGESEFTPMTSFNLRRGNDLLGGFCALIVVLSSIVCAPSPLTAQTKSNLSSSVTSESMTHVWVARERGLFKKYGVGLQFILMPRNPFAIAAFLPGDIDST